VTITCSPLTHLAGRVAFDPRAAAVAARGAEAWFECTVLLAPLIDPGPRRKRCSIHLKFEGKHGG